ncbi:MAG: DHH family phosphoesterase [Puniceicoccaceae bacterium]
MDKAAFLDPNLNNLMPASSIPGIPLFANYLVQQGSSFLVYGDYDVDGITASCQLSILLQTLGKTCRVFIPNRFRHGYGITHQGLKEAIAGDPFDTFVALDCGTNSIAVLNELLPPTLETFIVDHHQPEGGQLSDLAPHQHLINPHAMESPEQAKGFCTAGLVFKITQAVKRVLKRRDDARQAQLNLGHFLQFATLGTVADLVPLQHENRILVSTGLQRLARTDIQGLRALIKVSGLDPSRGLDAEDLAFRLAPRLNAGGRLGDATVPLELLLTPSEQQSLELADALNELNQQRQQIEQRCSAEAEAILISQIASGDCGLIAHQDDWHHGIVGIVAGRFTNRFHRPCLILGRDGDVFKGSGRSPDGVNLVQILQSCEEQPARWGGHPAAIGMTVESDRIDAFSESFKAASRCVLGGSPPEPSLAISSWVAPPQLDFGLLDFLEKLKPYGKGNPEPVFAIALEDGLRNVRPFGKNHLRASIPEIAHQEHSLVAWNGAPNPPPERCPIVCAVRLKKNFWSNREEIRVELIDWRLPA